VIDRRNSAEAERSIGDIMFFRAGEIHQSIYCRFPAKNINIELESEFFEKNAISETYLENTAVKPGHAKFTLLRIYNEMLRYDRYSPSSIEMLLLSLTSGNDVTRSFPKWLNRVVDLLNDSWNEDLSVNEIASAVNVHPKTVSKYFSRYVGCTLGEYRRQLKVERSLSLIRATDEPLTDIAQTCGFYDQSHFSGSFRRLTGFLPKHFRRL
jgi:AraC family transcriptional regulator